MIKVTITDGEQTEQFRGDFGIIMSLTNEDQDVQCAIWGCTSGRNFLDGLAAACVKNIIDFFGDSEDVSRTAIAKFIESATEQYLFLEERRRETSETEKTP